ncbi:MAG: hypothetical protein H7X95_13560 [Deltaproteobacteria bacterium]|nr:hypothetical protein [Deltaproteobacteria bacterium]
MSGWAWSSRLAPLCLLILGGGCGDDVEALRPPRLPPGDLIVAGPYKVVSSYDLTTSALLPKDLYGFVQDLRALRDDPAATFFKVLDEAGVPLVGNLLAVLPGPLEDRLKGWINEYVFGATFQGNSVRAEIDLLLEQVSEVLARFQLGSDLDLPAPDAGGRADSLHALRTLRFALWQGTVHVVVPIDLPGITLPGEIFVTEARVWATVAAGRAGADAHLSLSDHSFGIPYGRLAFRALNVGSQQRSGADVRGALGEVFNCPALGASVAQRCVLGVCVGHAGDLTAICERGLDEVVKRMRDRIEALNFNALRHHSGDASMWDVAPATGVSVDRRVDRLDPGVWKASIDIGMGPREIPASFVGARGL